MSTTYNPESILALLEKGKTSDDLAKEFTDALNSALELQEKKEKERAAAEEARRKVDEARLKIDEARAKARAKAEADKARKRKQQEADTEDLVDHFRGYFEEYYPEVEFKSDFTAAKIIDLIEGFIDVEKALKDMPKYPFNGDWMDNLLFKW